MANWFKNLLNGIRFARDENDGYFPLFSRLFSASPQFNDYITDQKKIEAVFSSPAVLKVFCLQCDLFSLGKTYVYKDDKEVEDDPVLKLFKSPNPMQSRSQWLWDLMFWNMIGTAYLYVDSDVPENQDNKLYFLDPVKMTFPREIEKYKDRLIFSKATLKDIGKINIEYRYEDGKTTQIPISKIIILTDLTNGIGNWFKGPSRIDALYKIISNSEKALDATNINLQFTGKFLVGGQADPKDVTKLPLSADEKQSIESIMKSGKKVHGVKSMIEIKRFVEDMRSLELGKAYMEAYYTIGSMFNIPKDVLEAYNDKGATYENQEKATARHISYTLEPKGNDAMEALSKRFGYFQQGKQILMSWDHLPFMQVFESDRAKNRNMQIQTLTAMLKLGISIDECNKFLDTDFKNARYEQPKAANGGANQAA